MTEKAPKTIEDISSELFDLEEPLHKARHFAEALRMIASSDGMRGEPGEAIETLERDRFSECRSSRPAVQAAWTEHADICVP